MCKKIMSRPKISVIVPVYQAEAYLCRCVDSVLNQTFGDFELLLIDDGSRDRSGEICDKYAKRDHRIKVFHKENGGVSSARQLGLDHAKGDYVIHVDPDDWIEKEMYEEMYKKIRETDADMVICDFQFEFENSSTIILQNFKQFDHIYVLKYIYQHMYGSCCNKLVRRSCLVQYNIQFPLELFCGEDLYVNTCLLSYPIKIEYIPKAFYHYDQISNQSSLVHKPLVQLLQQSQLLCNLLKAQLSLHIFNVIENYLLYQQAILVLRKGKPYIKEFRANYAKMLKWIDATNSSFKDRVLLKIAYNISPLFAHYVICAFRKIRRIIS